MDKDLEQMDAILDKALQAIQAGKELKEKSPMEELNREADIAREERRHLEMMAATIAGGVLSALRVEKQPGRSELLNTMRACIAVAQEIRDEQNRAGTEGKAMGWVPAWKAPK